MILWRRDRPGARPDPVTRTSSQRDHTADVTHALPRSVRDTRDHKIPKGIACSLMLAQTRSSQGGDRAVTSDAWLVSPAPDILGTHRMSCRGSRGGAASGEPAVFAAPLRGRESLSCEASEHDPDLAGRHTQTRHTHTHRCRRAVAVETNVSSSLAQASVPGRNESQLVLGTSVCPGSDCSRR